LQESIIAPIVLSPLPSSGPGKVPLKIIAGIFYRSDNRSSSSFDNRIEDIKWVSSNFY
jgi:hypothetical protein